MRNFYIIFKREMSAYFHSPIIYVFLVFFLILNGVFTFKISAFYLSGQADLNTFFIWHPWLYLFLIPAISMRIWSEELKSGTVELLFTYPIGVFEAMLGKFVAAWLFTAVAIFFTFPMVFTVLYLGRPDIGVIISGYVGSFLLAGTYLAIGSLFSASSRNQVISFIMTFVTCLILILIGFEPFIKYFKDLHMPLWLLEEIGSFSFYSHFTSIMKGIVDIRDIFFFLSLIITSLYCGSLVLENKKT